MGSTQKYRSPKVSYKGSHGVELFASPAVGVVPKSCGDEHPRVVQPRTGRGGCTVPLHALISRTAWRGENHALASMRAGDTRAHTALLRMKAKILLASSS